MTGVLVILRHGESSANADELFTGLLDVPLTERGRDEARRAGEQLLEAGLWPSHWVCSPQLRARQTADELRRVGSEPEEFDLDGRLLERNYGALTRHHKSQVLARYGETQFRAWRRSVDVAPPPLDAAEVARLEEPLRGYPHVHVTPTESLHDVIVRVEPLWRDVLLPLLADGDQVLVIAHGNSLRALCAVIDRLSDADVESLNIPNAHPLVYEVDAGGVPAPRGGHYLDPESAHEAAELIARGGGT
ncbi:MAG: 2,3-bisphosphoglycerate-dependent phosphoglycerate mutase [Propionibacterium sp.]|nr:2,3-bisphosphoglycerate-dependent phosphoglycerate mutase [Propionibacterium sp.]